MSRKEEQFDMKELKGGSGAKKGIIATTILATAVIAGAGIGIGVGLSNPSYTITINNSIDENGQRISYKLGDEVTLQAEEIEHYQFSEWQLDGKFVSNENPYTFVLTKDKVGEYTAVYDEKLAVNIAEIDNGQVTANLSEAVPGEEIVLTVVPNEHYGLKENGLYYIIGEDTTHHPIANNKFEMPEEEVTVYAEFELSDYLISIPAHVTVTRNGQAVTEQTAIHYQDQLTITYTESTGYEKTSFKINNSERTNGYILEVDGDVTITYTEAAITYTITVIDGTAQASMQYTIEDALEAPQPAGKTGYDFDCWVVSAAEGAWTNVDEIDAGESAPAGTFYGNVTLTAQYNLHNYTATFIADGVTIGTVNFTIADTSLEEPTVPAKNGYNGAWEDYLITADNITINAEYEIITYTATFIADGNQVGATTFTINDSELSNIPDVPSKTGYNGVWEAYTITASNMTINAVYTAIQYTAVFMVDGELFATRPFTIEDSFIANMPAVPAKAGHTGVWSEYTIIANDITINAIYSTSSYTITFQNWDGTEFQSGLVEYGQTPEYTGETPTRASTAEFSYSWSGWTPAIGEVSGDQIYIATFIETVRSYTIKFVDHSGEILSTSYNYGATVSVPSDPAPYSDEAYNYTFSGWSPTITTVSGPQTYTAQYTPELIEYDLTLPSNVTATVNGEPYVTNQKVHYGDVIALTFTPTSGMVGGTTATNATEGELNTYTVNGNVTVTYDEAYDESYYSDFNFYLVGGEIPGFAVKMASGTIGGNVVIPEKVAQDGKVYFVRYLPGDYFSGGPGSTSPITSITFPSTMMDFGNAGYIFENCKNLSYIVINGADQYNRYISDDDTRTLSLIVPTVYVLPSVDDGTNEHLTWDYTKSTQSLGGVTYNKYQVKAFSYRYDTENKTAKFRVNTLYTGEVTIPSQVTYQGENYVVDYVDEYAFKDRPGITKITFASTIKWVGSRALEGCTGLNTIVVNSNEIYAQILGESPSLLSSYGNILPVGTIKVLMEADDGTNEYLNTAYTRSGPSGGYYVYTKK